MSPLQPLLLPRARLGALIAALAGRGYRVIGPTVRDGAIVYDDVASDADLPVGWTDEQAPGRYELRRRGDERVFGYAVGPHSWKPRFHAPEQRLFRAERSGGRVRFVAEPAPEPALALFGARSCDLSAIEVQDAVLAQGAHPDPRYVARRRRTFVVAVSCAVASASCFCTSMGTGPSPTRGFDLALSEIYGSGAHRFVVEVGSTEGDEIARELDLAEASAADRELAAAAVAETARTMNRTMDTTRLRDLLVDNPDHPRWDEVADRCLACTSCTMVCPTCFCSTVEDRTDVTGEVAERSQRWDSCFTEDFSHVHGGAVRSSVKSRYRQWLTHKLATWFDQFGRSGCVGCGRCITWCPAGIDITEEVRAIRGRTRHRRAEK